MTIKEVLESVLIGIGVFFTFSAAVGVWRLPDFYSRMHAVSKVSSFGVGFCLIAVAIHYGHWTVILKALLVFLFIVLTNPIGAHMLMRSAYHLRTPKTALTHVDEYEEYVRERFIER